MQNGVSISEQQAHIVPVSDEGDIQALIKPIRGVQVILDRDVARLYGVATGALNRQVKRNEERFPDDFMFRLSAEEWDNLKCQIGISSWGGDRQLPYAFTENGIAYGHRSEYPHYAGFFRNAPVLACEHADVSANRGCGEAADCNGCESGLHPAAY